MIGDSSWVGWEMGECIPIREGSVVAQRWPTEVGTNEVRQCHTVSLGIGVTLQNHPKATPTEVASLGMNKAEEFRGECQVLGEELKGYLGEPVCPSAVVTNHSQRLASGLFAQRTLGTDRLRRI